MDFLAVGNSADPRYAQRQNDGWGAGWDDAERRDRDPVAAQRDDFFARKQAENSHRPSNLPPSQGGKYAGFGSSSSFQSAQSQPRPQPQRAGRNASRFVESHAVRERSRRVGRERLGRGKVRERTG